jgi:hypothetical protein
MIQEPEPLKYKLQDLPQKPLFLKPLGNTSHLPFKVTRSYNNNLPVYTDYKYDRTIKSTIIRNVYGDIEVYR